jgi:uncharacterized protein
MPVQSVYNVIVPLDGRESDDRPYFALFNTLAGSIDILDQDVARELGEIEGAPRADFVPRSALTSRRRPKSSRLAPGTLEYLARRGYLWDTRQEEAAQARMLYQAMLRFHRRNVRQPIIVVPTYNCNLKCPYCWQRLYHLDSPVMSEEMIDHLFEVLPSVVEAPKPDYVALTVFGGEPLQDDPLLRSRVVRILDRGLEAGYTNGIITNGVGLGAALPEIKGKVKVIQLTFDGPARIHRKRRPLPGGDSFTPLAEAVSEALAAGIRIRARVNVDETNLEHLPELADYARERGWLDDPHMYFHLAPVKNHNPRHPGKPERELFAKILELVERDPRMAAFDLTGFAGLKYFKGFQESGLFSLHRFFNCEAQINCWVLDLRGDVYACWDSAGLQHLAVGRFDPAWDIDPARLARWRDRNALEIEACQSCASAPHCGGGCQFLAYEHAARHDAPACDALEDSYVYAIRKSSEWLCDHARAGDHAVGLVTREGVLTAVDRPFGLILDEGGTAALEDATGCG